MTTSEFSEVKTTSKADEQHVIDTLVLAFSSDPLIRWFYPNPHDYLQYAPKLFEHYGGKAFDHETAYYVEDFSAAALWLPPGESFDEEAIGALFQETLSEDRQEQAWTLFEQIDSYHPNEPYWFLPAIGVDPPHQRRGLGSVLMKHALATCDEEETLAYLESSNPENIQLYVRQGFKILGTIHGETMPPVTPMLREPQ
ncbi:GNAT family N-acetyltransferase [Haloarcula marina]|uniref:GNAT family N-acetyltransferase n=1 Tax=Haloarcula marina TaxID=2961574 RepID=UPI0020B883DB|nr:GNAT family N-acetyltransferase [Halomicroarcula marina]